MKLALAALSAIGLIALSACTIPTPASPPGSGTADGSRPQTTAPAASPGVRVDPGEGAAPQTVMDNQFVRANEVRNSDGLITIGLSFGTLNRQKQINDRLVTVLTDAGTSLPLAFSPDLTVKEYSLATITLTVPRPTGSVYALTVDLHDIKVVVPLPEDGRAIAWPSAPLRQTALPAAPLRFTNAEVTVQTVRTQGLFTEVTFAALGLNGFDAQVVNETAAWTNPWELIEPDGTRHPALPGPAGMRTTPGRTHGIVRFAGELKASSTQVTLNTRAGSWINTAIPVKVDLPSHADSPVRPAAGDLTRPAITTPVKLTTRDGLTATVDHVDVLSDSIQVHTIFQGSPTWDLVFSPTDTTITDSAGVVHEMFDGNGTEFRIPRNGKLETTLVFAGAPDATESSLQLKFAATMANFTGTVQLPPASGAQPAKDATFADVENDAPPVPPTLSAVPLPLPTDPTTSPSPQAGTLAVSGITDLPRSSESATGAVFSSVRGVTSDAASVASAARVDAQADASAQRSLRDLGAKKTPDGYVLTLPETVLFDYNVADVKPAAASTLDKVAKLLAYYDRVQIGVNGHTDDSGEPGYNLDLSKRRAQAVADALKTRGVASSRMKVEGFGLTQPVASNADDAGKTKNRRVEIVLRENS